MLSWQQRIDRAKETVTTGLFRKRESFRGFTRDDVALASDWMTCSCGMLDNRIPRDFTDCDNPDSRIAGAPIDKELRTLGFCFFEAVEADDIERAEMLYRKIQIRAELLIEQIESASQRTEQECPAPSNPT